MFVDVGNLPGRTLVLHDLTICSLSPEERDFERCPSELLKNYIPSTQVPLKYSKSFSGRVAGVAVHSCLSMCGSPPLRGHRIPPNEMNHGSWITESPIPAEHGIIVLAPGLPRVLELPPELTFASASEALTTIRLVCPYGGLRYEGPFDPRVTPDFKAASAPLFFKDLPTRIWNYISKLFLLW